MNTTLPSPHDLGLLPQRFHAFPLASDAPYSRPGMTRAIRPTIVTSTKRTLEQASSPTSPRIMRPKQEEVESSPVIASLNNSFSSAQMYDGDRETYSMWSNDWRRPSMDESSTSDESTAIRSPRRTPEDSWVSIPSAGRHKQMEKSRREEEARLLRAGEVVIYQLGWTGGTKLKPQNSATALGLVNRKTDVLRGMVERLEGLEALISEIKQNRNLVPPDLLETLRDIVGGALDG